MIQQYAPLILAAVFVSLLIIGMLRHFNQQRRSGKAWDKLAAEHPEEFLADGDWVFVKYKDEVFPMTALEKIERWDPLNAEQRREFYKTIKRAIKKGNGSWVKTEDGNKLYLDNKKKRELLVERYHKATRNFERRFTKQAVHYQKNLSNAKPTVRRQHTHQRH